MPFARKRADPSGQVIVLEGKNRLRNQFCPYAIHKSATILTYATCYSPDCSAKRDIAEIQRMVDAVDKLAFKGQMKMSVMYESARCYRVGWTRAHFLARYQPSRQCLGVREYCGLPAFPEKVLKVSIYLAMVAAYVHMGSPDHKLFMERDQVRREKFVTWYVDATLRADELFGAGSLAEYAEFRNNFMQWGVDNLRPLPGSQRGERGERQPSNGNGNGAHHDEDGNEE